mmetsp:Transcript_16936/g.46644  ORF Transcript_16936/g.46644 Transcript_16936/m.46644 type:complete len:489 (-) Transcript_16936:140-1606(-)
MILRAFRNVGPSVAWARAARTAAAGFQPLPMEDWVPLADATLRIWVAGRGEPIALLLPPLRPGARGGCHQWSAVAHGILDLHAGNRGDDSSRVEGPAVWVAEWLGWEASQGTTRSSTGGLAARGMQRLLALANIIAQAHGYGRLRLVAGAEGAGLLALQALRVLNLRDGKQSTSGVSVVAVAPSSWAAPLPMLTGEDYPARLSRRQRFGTMVQRLLAKIGWDKALARWLVPESSADADPALVIAWWLGLLDPVNCTRDVVRELLMGSRAVNLEAGTRQYKASCAASSAQEATVDDADDEDLAVGAISARSRQPAPESTPEAISIVSAFPRTLSPASCIGLGRPFLGRVVPLLLLLPELLPPQDRAVAVRLREMVGAVQCRLQDAAEQLVAVDSVREPQAALEVQLFESLLELDAHSRHDPGMVARMPTSKDLARSERGAAMVSAVLPISIEAVRGSAACLEEQPALLAHLLWDFAAAGSTGTPHGPAT